MFLSRRTWLATLAASVWASASRPLFAGDNLVCGLCSCSCSCQKVCRLVCEEKKITTTVWGVKCEEFCAPGPSDPGQEQCETIRASQKPGDPCSLPKVLRWTHWTPGHCGSVYTKQKLMKKTVTKMVPSYQWVVDDLCPACQTRCVQQMIPAGTEFPPAPSLAGVTLLPAKFASPE